MQQQQQPNHDSDHARSIAVDKVAGGATPLAAALQRATAAIVQGNLSSSSAAALAPRHQREAVILQHCGVALQLCTERDVIQSTLMATASSCCVAGGGGGETAAEERAAEVRACLRDRKTPDRLFAAHTLLLAPAPAAVAERCDAAFSAMLGHEDDCRGMERGAAADDLTECVDGVNVVSAQVVALLLSLLAGTCEYTRFIVQQQLQCVRSGKRFFTRSDFVKAAALVTVQKHAWSLLSSSFWFHATTVDLSAADSQACSFSDTSRLLDSILSSVAREEVPCGGEDEIILYRDARARIVAALLDFRTEPPQDANLPVSIGGAFVLLLARAKSMALEGALL